MAEASSHNISATFSSSGHGTDGGGVRSLNFQTGTCRQNATRRQADRMADNFCGHPRALRDTETKGGAM